MTTGSQAHATEVAPPFDDYAPGGAAYHRLMVALPAAGMATFAPLYSPHGLLPRIGEAFDVSETTSSLVMSAGTIGLTISALIWSVLGDRFGRPRVMKAAMIAAALLGFVVAVMPTFPLILAARMLQGLVLGALPVLALAYLSEQVEKKYTVLAAGAFVAGNSFGGLTGRIMAGPIGAEFGWRIGLGSVAVISILATVLFCVTLPPPRNQLQTIGSVPEMMRNVWAHLRNPDLLAIYAQGFVLLGVLIGTYNYLTYRLEGDPFNLPTWLTSLLFLSYLAGTVTAKLTGKWAVRWGRRRVLNACAVTYIIGIVITLVDNVFIILFGLVLLTGSHFACQAIAAGWAGVRPSFGVAQSTSLYNMCYYAGAAVIGYLCGFPYRWFGWPGVVITMVLLLCLAQAMIICRRDLNDG